MAETTAEVRRDIEMTRERMSSTLTELERRLNVKETIRDNPWPALGAALAAGYLLSGSSADSRAAEVTGGATRRAGSKLGSMLDDVVATMSGGVQDALHAGAEALVGELKTVLTATIAGIGAGAVTAKIHEHTQDRENERPAQRTPTGGNGRTDLSRGSGAMRAQGVGGDESYPPMRAD